MRTSRHFSCNKFCFALSIVLLWGFSISAQNNFYNVYGTIYKDQVLILSRCADAGYYMVGYSYNINTSHSDFFIIRTDSSGNMMWDKTISFDSTNVGIQGGFMMEDE